MELIKSICPELAATVFFDSSENFWYNIFRKFESVFSKMKGVLTYSEIVCREYV